MGFFVKQELEVLVGSAGWGEKVGPTPRPGAEALVQTLREGETVVSALLIAQMCVVLLIPC